MTALLKLIGAVPLRWWLYAAGAAAICFILWREHQAIRRAHQLAAEKVIAIAERDQARATIETMKVDAALNKETTHALVERLAAVPAARPLSVFCQPAAAVMPAESRAAGGTDAAAERGSVEAPLRDIGAALEAARVELQSNNTRMITLQEWETKRAH